MFWNKIFDFFKKPATVLRTESFHKCKQVKLLLKRNAQALLGMPPESGKPRDWHNKLVVGGKYERSENVYIGNIAYNSNAVCRRLW